MTTIILILIAFSLGFIGGSVLVKYGVKNVWGWVIIVAGVVSGFVHDQFVSWFGG